MADRVLLVASAGGHWVQLARLVPAFEGMDVKFVTTVAGGRAPMGRRAVAVVWDASQSSPWRLPPMMAQMMVVLIRFRPDIIVTTGAAPGVVALWLGKILLGARTVWIDSVANSEKVSLSARLVEGKADLRLTQWAHLADAAKGIDYFGAVL
ncbi:glucuronosyltransferase [Caulobacter sp. DWR2-3-1b2]|uniref:glucuronosyltransferase n=1 Tax=unclassified Caulobacter TaxID=2648921 RepID=UPI003CF9190D